MRVAWALVVLLLAPAALLPMPGSAGPPGLATLATPAAEVVVDLTEPGGAVVGLRLPDGSSLLQAEGAGGVVLVAEGVALPDLWTLRSSAVLTREDGAKVLFARWEVGIGPPLAVLQRTFTLRPDVAGLVVETRLASQVPVYLTDYRLLAVGLAPSLGSAALRAHDYNGGADWNDDFHRAADAAPPFDGRAQVLEAQSAGGAGVAMTLVRRGGEASRITTQALGAGALQAAAQVNLSRELLTVPFPPYQVDPGALPGGVGVRGLPVLPGGMDLEPVLLAAGGDDLAARWAHHRLLTTEAPGAFAPTVSYNSNVWDGGGDPAADLEEQVFLPLYELLGATPYSQMNRTIFQREVPLADLAGVEVFVLDDGWQYLSGDWEPHPSKFPGGLGPERDLLAAHDMALGLWLSPLEFNLRSRTALTHPHWVCQPTGTVTALVPNQAGFGIWNPQGPGFADHLREAFRRLGEESGAAWFKLDFMTWVDCAGATPATIHTYAMAFRDILRAAMADQPGVVLQLDETNDHRFFGFESLWLGMSWFQNGNPTLRHELDTLADLAPFVPLHSVGLPALHGNALAQPERLADVLALWGHPTVWSRLSNTPEARLAQAGDWFRFYRAHADLFAGLTLPLEAPAPAVALERVRPDRGEAFVAVLDPDRALADGTMEVVARLRCVGEVEASDPLGGWSGILPPRAGDELPLTLPFHEGAAAALLRCV